MECLIDDMDDDFLPLLPTSDSTLPEASSESSEIATLLSSPFRNKDKDSNFLSHSSDRSSDRELLFFLELTVTETLLSFSSENEDKVFNLRIPISKGVYSFTLGLSHRTYATFKIVNVHPNILNKEIPSDKSKDSLAEETETKSNIWDDGSEDVNPFGGGNPLLTKETESEPIIWDIGDEEEEYPFVNEYPSFKKEPIMFVEDESEEEEFLDLVEKKTNKES
ncbi:hypothetical protein Tco_0127312 [Tanacetum coccineum]